MSRMSEIAIEIEEYLEDKGINLEEIDDYENAYLGSLVFTGVLNGELSKEAALALHLDVGSF